MKKFLNVCFVGLMLASIVLAGCSNGAGNNDNKNPLTTPVVGEKFRLKDGVAVEVKNIIESTYKKLVPISKSKSARAIEDIDETENTSLSGEAPEGYEWKEVKRTILTVTYPDGTVLDVYEDEENLEDGSTYLVLSETKKAEVDEYTVNKFSIKEYGYNFCFYEIVNFEDNTTYKLNIEGLEGVIVRNYPSLNMWIYDEAFTRYYGTTMTKAEFAEILKTKFDSNIESPDESWWGAAGWSTHDENVNMWICHQVGSMRFYKGKPEINLDDLSNKGISIETGRNGNQCYVYDKFEEPEKGKTYKWLNQYKRTDPEMSNDGAYCFYLFEEVADGYLNDYPSLMLIIKPLDNDSFGIHYGDSKVWASLEDVTKGFKKSWSHDENWGWGTYDKDVDLYVCHRIHTYRYDIDPA